MKRLLIILELISVLVQFCSCDSKPTPKNFIVAVDLSKSRDSTTIMWYKQTIVNSIFHKMSWDDRIVILPIDHYTTVWDKEIFKIDFSDFSYENEFAGLEALKVSEKNFKDTLSSALQNFELNFEAVRAERIGFANGTDVLGTLRLCKKYILPEHENNIVLLSDMQHITTKDGLNLEKDLLDDSNRKADVASIESINLEDSRVVVLTGPQQQTGLKKFSAIKSFWESYLSRCNAEVIDYGTGAVTKLEQTVSGNK